MMEVKIAPEAPIVDQFGEDLEGQAIVFRATVIE